MSQQGMRTFSTEFKEAVVVRLDAGERMAAVFGRTEDQAQAALRMASGLSRAWRSRAQPEART